MMTSLVVQIVEGDKDASIAAAVATAQRYTGTTRPWARGNVT